MSSIPFIEVAGRFTIPLLRSPTPRSHGREWALLAPRRARRTDIRSLYAAIVRTTCLGVDEFCTLCRWETGERRQPMPTNLAAMAGRLSEQGPMSTPFTASVTQPIDRSAGKPTPKPIEPTFRHADEKKIPLRRPRYRASRPSFRVDGRLARRAGIIGALALMGWLAVDQMWLSAQRHDTRVERRNADGVQPPRDIAAAAPTGVAPAREHDARKPAPPREAVRHEAVPREVVRREAVPRSVISAPASTGATRDTQLADTEVTGHAKSRRATSRRPETRSHSIGVANQSTHRAMARPPLQRSGTGNRHDRPDATLQAARRSAPPASSRAGVFPSAHARAGHSGIANDGPRASALRPNIEPLAGTALPPSGRPITHAATVDWASQISQRRVTEVPDQFSK